MAVSDLELLQQYALHGNQGAFTELVRRHLNLVYSVALRQVRSTSLAEEVSQLVFVDLARSAKKIRANSNLTSWLYQVACRKSIDTVRKESRRQHREHVAANLAEFMPTSSEWETIEPYLDEAMESLNEMDRTSILLRFFENKSLREVGEFLGASENAAQKRVNRAVERLRVFFSQRGVTVGVSSLIALLSTNTVQSAPFTLSSAISASALSGVNVATGVGAGNLFTMTIQKALVTTVVIAGVGTGVYEAHRASDLQKQLLAFEQPDPRPAPFAQTQKKSTDQLAALQQENEQLRSEITALRKESRELAQWKAWEVEAAKDPSQKAMLSWLERVDRLNQRMIQTPNAQIPELKLLSDQNWLEATDNNFLTSEEDYRKALAELRRVSEKKFVHQVQAALKNYERDRNQFPTDLTQLRPYLDPSIDDAMLQAWAIVPKTKKWLDGDWMVTRKNVIDEKLDFIWTFNAYQSSARPSGLDPAYGEISALKAITKAYVKANSGREPTDPSQLMPYAITAEHKFLIQKMIQNQQTVPSK